MRDDVTQWIRSARGKLCSDALTDADLDDLAALLREPRQVILYLYSKSTNMRSAVAGWVSYDPSEPPAPKLPSDEPPYESVMAAMGDGWRVVQFPVPTLYEYSELDNSYLGYEFVLEKWE
ncbi:hypothetical protein CMK11_18340 [Candidatus Poribacteria bacterium]|nr:hypothetical protein [Candidatus Poribacteria bacterium]